ncbi:dihydroxyacetone kinase subunit L [Prodigiosinella aquatilis]|nr:dihydroxyacetone kinase subunit L [Prodigiosinella sp. LS101]WJV54068.1 dihydroxyacetone kinase subunit L [Prodigiosinella sp. LS101]WJV58430.1 dihydroxyacetone kinase subunit L [Pectobacteriaceae bacterium C111]
MNTLTTEHLKQAIARIQQAALEQQAFLCAADAQLGDGDLGVTFSRGWTQAREDSVNLDEDWGTALFTLSKSFQLACSSSFGTLMATAFMAAAKSCKGKKQLSCSDIAPLLATAVTAMTQRGKGELGQKSVLDIVNALANELTSISTFDEMKHAARLSCQQTLDTFRPRPNLLGRARMFPEKSQGLDDPGMLAIKVLIDAL